MCVFASVVKEMMLNYCLLLITLLSLRLPVCCQGRGIHIITPDYTAYPCAEFPYPCFTLDDYLTQNSTNPFPSFTFVVFLPGYHILSANTKVVILGVSNLVLTGLASPVYFPLEADEALSHIVCKSKSGFSFLASHDIEVANLTFSFCGYPFPDGAAAPKHVALLAISVHFLHLSHTVIQNSTGQALFGINVLGNSIIENSIFCYNNYDTREESSAGGCAGGAACFIYLDLLQECPPTPLLYSLHIRSSLFAYGVSVLPYGVGSGLAISSIQSTYGVEVLVENSTFSQNHGLKGANIAIFMPGNVYNTTFTVRHCSINEGNPDFIPTVDNFFTGDYSGTGLMYSGGAPIPIEFPQTTLYCMEQAVKHRTDVLSVLNTNFTSNSGTIGAGIYIFLLSANRPVLPFIIAIENCSFVDNRGSPGSAIVIYQEKSIEYFALALQIIVNNCTFTQNSYPYAILPNHIQKLNHAFLNTMTLLYIQDVIFVNCWFEGNIGTPIYAYNSQLHFFDEMTFVQNSGVNGGGLYLNGDSLMLLLPNTHMYFLNNTASVNGGGIFVSSKNSKLCFFQTDHRELSSISNAFPDPQPDGSILPVSNPKVILESNTAGQAGSAIYGGNIDNCNAIIGSIGDYSSYTSDVNVFDGIFNCSSTNCTNDGDDKSLISSDPYKLCPCDAITLSRNCSLDWPQTDIYPGQTFDILVSSFAQRGGISPGVVFADFLPSSLLEKPVLGDFEGAQEVKKNCTNLTFTIFFGVQTLNMTLSFENPPVRETPANILIQLHPCPSGFNFSVTSSSCQCNDFLQMHDITCDIDTQTIRRPHQKWVSLDFYTGSSGTKKDILLHNFCPFDYCLMQELNLNLSSPDVQCKFQRAGILCGACQENLSVILGGSQCLSCSNSYLSLLIPFALAGICLVFLLFVLNTLTVATGILNGLLFYANIIQYNRGIFFPCDKTNVLTVFISWLNLDLGIHTCFYDGMDTYSKTWLQYVFPVYIWLIVVAIIVTSHYSIRVSKMAGNHTVPVLATLFLLSFAKILRTIIASLSVTIIDSSNSDDMVAWLFDANIRYIRGKHIPLFLFGIFALLFLAIPFVFILTFTSLLLKLSAHRLFKWVNRLKPFFDAFQGPYKNKQWHWTGILLIMRAILFLIYSFNVLQAPAVILLSTFIASCVLMAYGWFSGGIYKKWPLDVLEISFFLNLNILASASFYVYHVRGNQCAVTYISTATALLEFVGIIVYSLNRRFALAAYVSKCQEFFKNCKRMFVHSSCESQSDTVIQELHVMETIVDRGDHEKESNMGDDAHHNYSKELREPLLELEVKL